VIGRFKAGKSSFLNHFFDRDLLPVGVTPVTTVVTEICYGARERAGVHFLDGHMQEIAVNDIRYFIAERENPGNQKRVSMVRVELPQLAQLRAFRFVDMPGLESALAHNTEAALTWLPNVGLALVAVSVDPPLSQHDMALLKSVYEYTPNVSILLTKVDLLTDTELAEVMSFVSDHLAQVFGSAPKIFPYSVRPGYAHLKRQIDETLFRGTLEEFEENRHAVLNRKLETLLRECHDYLAVALKSAETIGSEREALRRQIIGEKESLEELKSQLRLVVLHAAGSIRAEVSKRLETHKSKLQLLLSSELKKEFPSWTKNLAFALEHFEQWLRDTLSRELMRTSSVERNALVAPLDNLKQQIFRSLQNFRDRLSERTESAFGVALRTTESEIEVEEPQTPDIFIGKVFDRNWELLSAIIPMSLVKPLIWRHFRSRLPSKIEMNLSRVTSQWDENIRAAMMQILKEAQRRLDELVETVERLITTSSDEAPIIRADIERLDNALNALTRLGH
jgi:GTP-binding protein EngB required for normal cell division